MRLGVFCAAAYSNQAALRSQLTAMTSGANPASLLVTAGVNPGDAWARQWAQDNGVPWISRSSFLQSAGFAGGAAKVLATIQVNNLDTILSATGQPASQTVFSQFVAVGRGLPLTVI